MFSNSIFLTFSASTGSSLNLFTLASSPVEPATFFYTINHAITGNPAVQTSASWKAGSNIVLINNSTITGDIGTTGTTGSAGVGTTGTGGVGGAGNLSAAGSAGSSGSVGGDIYGGDWRALERRSRTNCRLRARRPYG